MAVSGNDVENDAPARARNEAGPVVVSDDDLVIFRVAAGGDEGAAITGADEAGRLGASLLLVENGT